MNEQNFSATVLGKSIKTSFFQRVSGEELIVFIHGWGCSAQSFRRLLRSEEFADYSVLVPDLPGFGDSEKPEWFSYSIEDIAMLCSALILNLHQGPLHIVGHSMGGAVALLLEEDVFNHCNSFVSIEGNLTSEDCGVASRRVTEVGLSDFARTVLPQLAEEYYPLTTDYFDFNRAAPHALYKSALSLVNWSDSGSLLKKFLDFPYRSAYIGGEKNATHPTCAKLNGLPLYAVSGSGHFPMNDNPSECASLIKAFIRSKQS